MFVSSPKKQIPKKVLISFKLPEANEGLIAARKLGMFPNPLNATYISEQELNSATIKTPVFFVTPTNETLQNQGKLYLVLDAENAASWLSFQEKHAGVVVTLAY